MSDWRDRILREFTPGIQALTVVADPDGLLTEPMLGQALMQRGFELLVFEEPISFRFAFESRFRSRMDAGETVDLVILCIGGQPCDELPFDVLSKARQLSFSLADFFPNLSYPVLRALETQHLDSLFEAQSRFNPGVLGDNATKDFVLRHVFEIAAELIKTEVDLLRVLLRRHYRLQVIPEPFVDRLVAVLGQSGRFQDWPLADLFTSRSQFFTFLQERWPLFLARLTGAPLSSQTHFSVQGPMDLPFDDPDIRVYVDNLFVEGMLHVVDWDPPPEGWAAVGVRQNPQLDRTSRFAALAEAVERKIPGERARHEEWFSFAQVWAELNLLATEVGSDPGPDAAARIAALQALVDTGFCEWLRQRLGSLSSLPATAPVMVHHIARFLAGRREAAGKVALVVVDGMAFDQWLVIRDALSLQRPGWQFEENAVFAWVPTITSVSRQSIFAGKAPLYFPASIYTTDRESSLWQQFWVGSGLGPQEVAYLKGLGDKETLRSVADELTTPRLKAVGAVVDKVDRIMHGMELGTAGMHNQVRQWASEGFLAGFLDILMTAGFDVYVTADHGNVESTGCGQPKEGLTADVRGERVRIYSDPTLRAHVSSKFPNAIPWKPIGLPNDFLPLLLGDRRAFIPEGQRTVAHGGLTLEEVVVPFVRLVGEKQ